MARKQLTAGATRKLGPAATGPRPRKQLGQHFLRDSGVLADIVHALTSPPGALVLEIGAGTGQLTAALLDAGYEVIALEIEPRLVRHLRERFVAEPRLRIVQDDARTIDLGRVIPAGRSFAVAGNLPYFAANPIVRRLLEAAQRPAEIVVMVQREVAREMAAPAGRRSLLSLAIQVYAEPQLLFDVPPEAFDPPPAVYSTVLRLEPRQCPLVRANEVRTFFDFASRAFRNPRKQLHNALARETGLTPADAQDALQAAGIDGKRRAETLTVEEWKALVAAAAQVDG